MSLVDRSTHNTCPPGPYYSCPPHLTLASLTRVSQAHPHKVREQSSQRVLMSCDPRRAVPEYSYHVRRPCPHQLSLQAVAPLPCPRRPPSLYACLSAILNFAVNIPDCLYTLPLHLQPISSTSPSPGPDDYTTRCLLLSLHLSANLRTVETQRGQKGTR